jgi:ADP-heptose:LPS heptosyltransferase
VVDLVGRTNLRDFVLLMHHAAGVLCPVTFAMHLAAAVEPRPGKPRRPCVVVAGAREPAHWEQYPGHQFLHTIGSLPCCASDPCWRSRCQLVGDGDEKDRREVCERPIQVSSDLRIPECMELITPTDVIRAIERCLPKLPLPLGEGRGEGGLNYASPSIPTDLNANQDQASTLTPAIEPCNRSTGPAVLIDFRHGLGDTVQLTSLLAHLRHYHADWQIDVAAGAGKLPAASSGATSPPLYRQLFNRDRDRIDRHAYEHVFDLSWDECPACYADSPSTKVEHCLRSVFNVQPIRELCGYEIPAGPGALAAAKSYLESVCGPGTARQGRYPAVLLHYQGNTSTEQKNLSHDLARRICEAVLEASYVPVILDWDHRTPLADGARIFNPDADAPLWGGIGTGDCETLTALIAQSSLFVGIDSGPLHVAGGVANGQIPTPAIAVWTGHHPLHYLAPAEHVTHLVPEQHTTLLRGDRQVGLEFFQRHYRHRVYRELADELPLLVRDMLPDEIDGLVRRHQFWVRGDNVEQDLVIVRDIAEQDSYRIAELEVPGPIAVDIGAHIGVFSRAFKRRHPSARVVAVECCPENLAALQRNVGDFAAIVPAAMTYEREVALLNAVYPGCVSTGGSTVVPRAELEALIGSRARESSGAEDGLPGPSCAEGDGARLPLPPGEGRGEGGLHAARAKPSLPVSLDEYWLDGRPLATVTLEQIIADHHLERIDVLKLDCEGSEFSILQNTTSLDRIGAIVGEYHGREQFLELVARRFAGWQLRIVRDGDPGTFWLIRRADKEQGQSRLSLRERTSFRGAKGDGLGEPSSVAEFWERFLAIVHPVDQPVPDTWRSYYGTLFELARELRPRRVCEIGVRAGYSAFAILSANPAAFMLGIEADLDEATQNTHWGRQGLYRHAEKILAPFDYQLLIADSHALARLPRCDLIYIDGDHTFDGCLADLRLAERSSETILVDDYDSIPSVRQACDLFAAERPEFTPRHIANGLTGFLLFERGPPSPFGRGPG